MYCCVMFFFLSFFQFFILESPDTDFYKSDVQMCFFNINIMTIHKICLNCVMLSLDKKMYASHIWVLVLIWFKLLFF